MKPLTGSRSLTVVYDAERGGSVVPTDEVRTIGEVALEHGVVEAKGRDSSGAVTRSTADHPEVLQDKYDPDELSESNAFRRLILKKIGRV